MSIEGPVRVEAEILHKEMKSGRNKAVLLGCRASNGSTVDCVVKFAECLQGRAPLPYLAEWCAVAFGRLLGIPVPDPFEVQITLPFAKSLDHPWREIATKSVGSAFGSKLCTSGYMSWVARATIPVDMREAAVALVAFDVFIHNVDRRITNPNVLVARQAFLAIDHDDAFAFLLPILGAPLDPAEDPLLEVVDQHVLAQELGRKVPPLAGFRAAVAAVTDEQIEAIGRATPAVWQVGLSDGKLARLLDVMRRRRDAIEKWLPQVEARIQR